MNILITGIHGFVGTNLTPLLKSNYTIFGLDIINKPNNAIEETIHWDNLEQLPPPCCPKCVQLNVGFRAVHFFSYGRVGSKASALHI